MEVKASPNQSKVAWWIVEGLACGLGFWFIYLVLGWLLHALGVPVYPLA